MTFWLKKQTPKEAAAEAKKQAKREVRSGQREIEREIRDLERQETKLKMEIKQRAKQPGVSNSDSALRAMSKNLIQVRNQRAKLFSTRAHLGAVGMQASAMASQVTATTAIGSVTGAMKTANKAVDAKEMSKIMNEFSRENEVMEMRQELMDDALTDVFDAEGVEEEAEEMTSQVLAELGIEMDKQFVGLATPSALPAGEQIAEEEDQLPDLKARLDAL